MIRTGKDTDLSNISSSDHPIHFHAVDTNGIIDDHRTIGTGKVNFKNTLSTIIEAKLTNAIIIEDGTRSSALQSKEMLTSIIKQLSLVGT